MHHFQASTYVSHKPMQMQTTDPAFMAVNTFSNS